MALKLSSRAESAYRLQQYGGAKTIDGVVKIPLKRFNDEGGSMIELMRLPQPAEALADFKLEQMNYSVLEPGVVKAFHVHRGQTDVWFVPPEDRVLLILADQREGSASLDVVQRIVLGDGNASMIVIPPGVAHGCRNIGADPARIIYYTDRLFSADPDHCDEGRLPWDFFGAEIWETPWD